MTAPALVIPPIQNAAEFERQVTAETFVSKFGAMFLDQIDEPGPEHDWLIDGWLSVGDKSVIGGPSQSGKSFLAIHAGMCIAHKADFFGSNVKHGLVIYQAGEGARGVKKRLRAWRKHHKVQFSRNTPFVLLQSKVDLYGSEDTPRLIEEIKAITIMYDVPLMAVFIDTLATAAIGAEENSARDIGIVMNNIATINAATGAHVCLVHHMNAGGDRLRGSTAIYANIDQTIFVKRDPSTKIRTASLGKQRDDDMDLSIQFELMSVMLGAEKHDRSVTSCVCLPVGEKDAIRRTEEQKGFALNPDELTFMRVFFDVERAHGEPVPESLKLPTTVRTVVRHKTFTETYQGQEPPIMPPGATEEERADAQRKHTGAVKKQIQRLGNKLKAFGVVGFGQDGGNWLMWWTGKPLRAFPQTVPVAALEPEVPIDLGAAPF